MVIDFLNCLIMTRETAVHKLPSRVRMQQKSSISLLPDPKKKSGLTIRNIPNRQHSATIRLDF